MTKYDLIKTIEDDQHVPDFSEPSDDDDELQLSKKKKKQKNEFASDFHFVNNITEYQEDPWSNLTKDVKKKTRTKLDDKIKKIRDSKKKQNGSVEEPIDISEEFDNKDIKEDFLDEDDKKDVIKEKEKKVKKKKSEKKVESEKAEFEEWSGHDSADSFYNMNLSKPLLKAIASMNFLSPTPIQMATIPVALLGRDICGCAATGTGKTAAYMLPILERLMYRSVRSAAVTRVLVLVPTRELGVQVFEVTKQLCQFTTLEVGLSVGGLDLKLQESALRKKPDIVIATPGRLIDHLKNTPTFALDTVQVLVLDEADRMLNEYFAEQMKYIIKQCARTRQTMLFSATMTEEVKDLAAVSLDKPVKVFVDSNQTVAFNLQQQFVRIRKEKEEDREAILAALVCRTFHDHTMVFAQTKKQVHRLHILLGLLGISVGELHGNLTQPQRLENLRKFKDEEIDVLLATDVAARGLDIVGVKTVINFHMPLTLQHYIHRVGRTARAGRGGISVSLAGDQECNLVKQLIKEAKNPVQTRVVPTDTINLYRNKIESFEEDIERILQEEKNEKEIVKIENKANKAEKILKNVDLGNKRSWFQTYKERQLEKEKLSLVTKPEPKKSEKKSKKKTSDDDGFRSRKTEPQKRKSSYANDLTDVSQKGVKRLRHEANAKNRERAMRKGGMKGKGGQKKPFKRR